MMIVTRGFERLARSSRLKRLEGMGWDGWVGEVSSVRGRGSETGVGVLGNEEKGRECGCAGAGMSGLRVW